MAAPLWIQNLFNAIGGVVAKVANNGSAVAPDSTTTQVILDFTGASTTYTPPGVGEQFGTLHVPLGGDGGSGIWSKEGNLGSDEVRPSEIAPGAGISFQCETDGQPLTISAGLGSTTTVTTQTARNAIATKAVGMRVNTSADGLQWICVDAGGSGQWAIVNYPFSVVLVATQAINTVTGYTSDIDGNAPDNWLVLIVNNTAAAAGVYSWHIDGSFSPLFTESNSNYASGFQIYISEGALHFDETWTVGENGWHKLPLELPGNGLTAKLNGTTSAALQVGGVDAVLANATDTLLGRSTTNSKVNGVETKVNGGDFVQLSVADEPVMQTDGTTIDSFVTTKRTKFQDANGYRTFEYEAAICLQLTNNSEQDLPIIHEVDYQADGSLVPGHWAEALIEVTISTIAFDHSGGGGTLSRTAGAYAQGTWLFAWSKSSPLPSGPTNTWNHINIGQDSGRHIGADFATDMNMSITLDHVGATDGDIVVELNHNTGTWATNQDWSTAKISVKITGAGRYE